MPSTPATGTSGSTAPTRSTTRSCSKGEITLLVDDGEATLKAGDVAIQRATSHAWSNRTDRVARVAFVLIGTEPISADEIARQRRDLSVRAG